MISGHNETRQLLKLYYSGMSSLDDERRLLKLLSSSDLPDHLEEDRKLLLAIYAKDDSMPALPDSFAENLSRHIDRLDRNSRLFNRGHRWTVACSIAASVAIVATMLVFLLKNNISPYEITDPQIAGVETTKALMLVSESLDKTDESLNDARHALSFFVPCDSAVNDSVYNAEYYHDNDTL